MHIKWLFFILILPSTALADLDESLFPQYENTEITDITITGHKITKDYIITRELQLQVGRSFNLNILKDDIQRLDNLMIFSSITVIPTDTPNGVALEFNVRELPWMIPYLKLSFTEENGWSAGPSLSALNMFGRDINLTGYLTFGGQTTYFFRFINPWFRGNHISIDFTAAHLNRLNKLSAFEETSDEVTLSLGRYLAQIGRAKLILSYFGVGSDTDYHTLDPDNRDNFFRMGASLGFDSRDSYTNSHHGWLNEIKLLRTDGTGSYWTYEIDVQRYQPVSDCQTLLLNSLVTLQTGTVGKDIPEYLQYFMGGANTIRGYDVDELPLTLFGKNQLIFTVEYQLILLKVREYEIYKWAMNAGLELALFSDTGIAWSRNEDFSANRAKTGFGIGLRALVPGVNEVRFDLGFNRTGHVEFHLGIQPKPIAQRFRLR